MGFKTETQVEKVILFLYYLDHLHQLYAGALKSLDCGSSYGRTKGQTLPNHWQLMPWAISFALPCVQDDLHTSVKATQTTLPKLQALPWEKAYWSFSIEFILLLVATNTNPLWWRRRLA